MIDNEASG